MRVDAAGTRSLRASRALGRMAVLLASLSLAPARASAWCRTTEPRTPQGLCERGIPVWWPVACVGVSLEARGLRHAEGQDLSALLRAHLPVALEAWSSAPCGERAPRFVLAPEVELDDPSAFDGRNVVSVNRRWPRDPFHLPGGIAVTLVTSDATTGAVLDVDIELAARSRDNPLGRDFADGPPAWGVVDLPTALLHELGHLAGLAHSERDDAVMSAGAGDVERRRRTLTADDLAGLCAPHPLTARRVRPEARCTPEPARAPSARLAGGVSCAASGPSRVDAGSAAAVVVALVTFARRRGRRGALSA